MIKDELRKGNSAITEHGKTRISRVGGGLEEGDYISAANNRLSAGR